MSWQVAYELPLPILRGGYTYFWPIYLDSLYEGGASSSGALVTEEVCARWMAKLQHEEVDVQPDLSCEEAIQILDQSMKTPYKKEVPLVQVLVTMGSRGGHMGARGWDAMMFFKNHPYGGWWYEVLAQPLASLLVVRHCMLLVVAFCCVCTLLGKFLDEIFWNGGGCKTTVVCPMGSKIKITFW